MSLVRLNKAFRGQKFNRSRLHASLTACRSGGQATREGTSAISARTASRMTDTTDRVFIPMTTGLTQDPEHWRDRAHEARIRAGLQPTPPSKPSN
jgi:hypothetical protein